MKSKILRPVLLWWLSCAVLMWQVSFAQSPSRYTFYSLSGDPMNVQIYKLANGLTVYMSVSKSEPRIDTKIVVKAGSKNDPADATGLAHYLEHMLFKGTDRFGCMDYAKEKTELDKIENLYEVYRKTSDTLKRNEIYRQIDSISGVAARYAIANEYDKMLSSIGARGTNAYTSVEQTVYINDIPSNQLEKWLTIEAERFRNPVMRIFHTELEAVYEEKNMSLDSDESRMYDTLLSNLFRKHTYGTQTTIGTIEHLKNPSIKKIKEYYQSYYVPNNMAICLSGDFDPDAAIQLIDAKFGSFKPGNVPSFDPPAEDPIQGPVIKKVTGPESESLVIGYRFPGAGSREADMISMITSILHNRTAGLINLNLLQAQKVLGAYSGVEVMKDYSVHYLSATMREGQTHDEAKKLLLDQLEEIKKGNFPDWLLPAIINNEKIDRIRSYESNGMRTTFMANTFIHGTDWARFITAFDRKAAITRQEIIDFAKKNYDANYVAVYKITGEDPNVLKVIKPAITQVETNRDAKSDFVGEVLRMQSPDISPVFLDYEKDIQKLSIKNNIRVHYLENREHNLFELYYVADMGTNNDRRIGIAVDYLSYLGTSAFSPSALKQEFYKLGCSFDVYSSEDKIYVQLSGLSENFEKSVELFESLLKDPRPDEEALTNLVMDILKKRADDTLSKDVIFWDALYSFGKYGSVSPFTNRLQEKELKALKAAELIEIIKGITGYQHRVLYYGPAKPDALVASLNRLHHVPAKLRPVPPPVKFTEQATGGQVYFVHYPGMKQAEILLLSKGGSYDKEMVPLIRLYNEYFGGGMSSVVFQDMRESKALAYGVSATYRTPSRPDRSCYVSAYIGTQADKVPEALEGMTALLKAMPKTDVLFASAREAVIRKIQTERIIRSMVLYSYESALKMGHTQDIRKSIFDKVPSFTLEDIHNFHTKMVAEGKYTLLIMGDKSGIDMKALEKYGSVKMLTLSDIFRY